MQRRFKNIFGYVTLVASLSSCSVQTSSNANSENQGILQSVVGGKTYDQSVIAGNTEKLRFDAIAKHVALVVVEEITTDPQNPNHTISKVISNATGVILNDKFLVTSAHMFENFKFDSNHKGVIFFGMKGVWSQRERREFSRSDVLNRNPDEIAAAKNPLWWMRPGNADYVFIRINGGLPTGYAEINMISDVSYIKKASKFHVAGFGISEGGNDDSLLRTLDLTLSRTSIDQPSTLFAELPERIGVEGRKFFLELFATGASTADTGDSGGPVYIEGTDEQGKPKAFLAGILSTVKIFSPAGICAAQSPSCVTGDYALRVDAFLNDALVMAKRLRAGEL